MPPFELITALSITNDRLDGIADLPVDTVASPVDECTEDEEEPASLFYSLPGKRLSFGSYSLSPQAYGQGGYRRLYFVHHQGYPDRIATLSTHPIRGKKNRCRFHIDNRLHYTGEAAKLLIGLLDAIGATNEVLTHWEIQTTHPRLTEVAEYINTHKLTRKGGRCWRVEVGEGGRVQGMQVGLQKSPHSLNLYRNGPTLERRNRTYISDRTVADGAATKSDRPFLARLEYSVKGRGFKGLVFTDPNGHTHTLTVRSLIDPMVSVAVFRHQIESCFVFRRKTGKDRFAVAKFFDWPAIEANFARLPWYGPTGPLETRKAPIYARMPGSTFSAKQTVRTLLRDGQPGSYINQTLREQLLPEVAQILSDINQLRAVADTITTLDCPLDVEQILAILDASANDTANRIAHRLSRSIPEVLAQAVAKEYGAIDYLQKQASARHAALPEGLTTASVKPLKAIGHVV